MCGIVGYVGQQEAAPILLDGLRRLEYRGYDSAGIAVCGDGQLRVKKSEAKKKYMERSAECLMEGFAFAEDLRLKTMQFVA